MDSFPCGSGRTGAAYKIRDMISGIERRTHEPKHITMLPQTANTLSDYCLLATAAAATVGARHSCEIEHGETVRSQKQGKL